MARRAEKSGARGGIPDKSLLEVLPNSHAGGRLFPPHHNGGRLCWAREYRPNPPLLLYSADSANVPFSTVAGSETRVRVYFLKIALSCFTLVWKLK